MWCVCAQVDAVELIGTRVPPYGVVQDLSRRVVYVPDQHMYGLDTFRYALYDCAFKIERQSKLTTVNVNLTGTPNVHTLNITTYSVSSELSVIDRCMK